MSNLQPRAWPDADAIVSKELHQSASEKAQEYIDDFAAALVLQAKILAFRDKKAALVLRHHVEEAAEFISSGKKKDRLRELLKILGGVFFGAFVPGIMTSLPANDIQMTVIYIILGFVGMLLVLLGLAI